MGVKKLLTQAIFVVPILAIITVPVILHFKSQSTTPAENNNAGPTYQNNLSTHSFTNTISSAQAYDKFAIPEPFSAANSTLGLTYAMTKSMDPNTWMKMMMNMMNPAMMTQMMHQMMQIPTKMMVPFMNNGFSMGPAMLPQSHAMGSAPNIMTPAQYKDWYTKQQNKLNNVK